MPYQTAWIRGKTSDGDRECAARYDVIREIVKPYTRQITVWDIGANSGYFGLRLAHEFQAVSVMVEPRSILVDVCRQNNVPTAIALQHQCSAEDLKQLAACEHADVVLALNVLHHVKDWCTALAALFQLGETLIIETPGRGDIKSANYERSQRLLEAIEALRPEVIAWAPSHVTPGVMRPIFKLTRQKTALTAGYIYGGRVRARGPHPPRKHVITSTLTEKTISYVEGETRPYVPGVNLWNFLQLGGAYPDRVSVSHAVARAAKALHVPHGDLRPWNVILRGASVQIIDSGHRKSVTDDQGLSDTLAWIANPRAAYVQ